MDRLSKEHRSWNMSRIRGKGTSPEKTVQSLLHKLGYRFRLHRKDLPGQPDIVLPRFQAVIFSWMLLASAQRLQIRIYAENPNRILATEIRREC